MGRITGMLWACYGALILLVSWRAHFAILSNDTLPLLFQAESLSWHEARSFYNGFFPIGYPITLRALLVFGRGHVDMLGVLLNAIASFGMIWALVKIYGPLLPRAWVIVPITVTLFLPEMLHAMLSLRPDLIVTVLGAVGLLAYHRDRYGWCGLILGISCLFRAHALALVLAFAIAALIHRGWRPSIKVLIAAVPFLVLQGVVGLLAGEGLMASAQGFNIAKMVYGAGWRQEEVVVPGFFETIIDQPLAVLEAYVHHLLNEWYLVLIPVAGLFFARSREVALIALLYLLAVGFGASPRGSLPAQPLVVLSLVLQIVPVIKERSSTGRWMPYAISVSIFLVSSIILFRSANKAGDRIERYENVGTKLNLRSADETKRVLTDDFAMYFPQLDNAAPYVNGGWGRIGIPLYRERIPQFMYSEPAVLRDSLIARGVNNVVLSQPSSDVRLERTVMGDAARFQRIEDISGYAVYIVR